MKVTNHYEERIWTIKTMTQKGASTKSFNSNLGYDNVGYELLMLLDQSMISEEEHLNKCSLALPNQ